MNWINEEELEAVKDSCQGFVYQIKELDTGKIYIGQKSVWYDKKLKPLKGKKNMRHFTVETDWKEYNSSNKVLQEKIKKNPDNYEKTIVAHCPTLTNLKATEAYLQLKEYLFGNWNSLYNEMINLRLRIRK